LISGSSDKTLKLWDLNKKYNSAYLRTFNGHLEAVFAVQLARDEGCIISGSLDKSIKVWNIENAQCMINLLGHSD